MNFKKNDIVILPLIDGDEHAYAFVEDYDSDCSIIESKVIAVAIENNRLLILCEEKEMPLPTLVKTSDKKELSENFGLLENTFAPLNTMVDVYTAIVSTLNKLNKKN